MDRQGTFLFLLPGTGFPGSLVEDSNMARYFQKIDTVGAEIPPNREP